jgi:CRISPR-associated protein Csx10
MFEKYGNELYVGTARTRGLGCLSIKEVSNSNPTTFELKAFDQRYHTIAKDSDSNSLYFTVTLLSDTILQDSFFRYQGVIKEENFKEFGINPGDIQLQDYMSDQVRIQGWNSAAGWPKEDEMAIRKGSVFLYRYRGETSALQRSLEKIQRNGIGARRAEGFGRVSINDPFHWEVER